MEGAARQTTKTAFEKDKKCKMFVTASSISLSISEKERKNKTESIPESLFYGTNVYV